MGFERTKMRLTRLHPRSAIQKRAYCGRHLRTETEEVGGRVYGRTLHATKGWRTRRVLNIMTRVRLIGI